MCQNGLWPRRHVQVQMEAAEPGSTSKLHFFSSFFYKKLTEKSGGVTSSSTKHEQNHERVRKWTKVRFAAH